MTLKAHTRFRRLQLHIANVLSIFNSVAGRTSQIYRRVHVIAGSVIGMTIQALRVLIYWNRMLPPVTKTWPKRENHSHAAIQPRAYAHAALLQGVFNSVPAQR
jgi:hypothetical protein